MTEQISKLYPNGPLNTAYAKFFTGNSYLRNLISDPDINVGVGEVSFEPGCRNHWHIHHNG